MMLQALIAYAERENLGDPDFEATAIHWLVPVSLEGRLSGSPIPLYEDPDAKKPRPKQLPRPFTSPNKLNQGDKSHFLADSLERALLYNPKDPDKVESRRVAHGYFKQLLLDAAEAAPAVAGQLRAAARLLDSPEELARVHAAFAETRAKPTDNVTFQVGGRNLLDEPQVGEFWRSRRRLLQAGTKRSKRVCLATGVLAGTLDTTEKIRGVPGGLAMGTNLISFDKDSFASYGLEHLHARLTGVADTSVALRRAQFRAADDPRRSAAVARQIIAGKLQNSRNSLLRAARESEVPGIQSGIETAADALARQIQDLGLWTEADLATPGALDRLRGCEGMGGATYFGVFSGLLKQQQEDFTFITRNRRPPRDRINCLLSFLYALVRHDCVAALTSTGLDPFVGFLHAERPNRPSLALDLMEEFRPWLADRLAVTLINRRQVDAADFHLREGGAVEFTEAGRKRVITAYQQRKQEVLHHPLLDQDLRVGQLPYAQARLLARHLRGDVADYVPLVPK